MSAIGPEPTFSQDGSKVRCWRKIGRGCRCQAFLGLTHSGRVANHTRWWLSKKAIEKRACPLDGVVRSRTVVLDAMAEVSAPRQHRHVVEAVVGGRIVYDVKEGRTLGHQRLEHPAILSRGPVVLVADQHQRRQGKPGVC